MGCAAAEWDVMVLLVLLVTYCPVCCCLVAVRFKEQHGHASPMSLSAGKAVKLLGHQTNKPWGWCVLGLKLKDRACMHACRLGDLVVGR